MINYGEHVTAFKALSDETRLKILDMLSCGELCACEILEAFSISQSTLSYHMKILSDCGLVSAVRDGAWMRYSLNKDRTEQIIKLLKDITTEKDECICKSCDKENVKLKKGGACCNG